MIKVIMPPHLTREMPDDMIKDICFLSFGDKEYSKIIEERGKNTGQYIKLKKGNKLKYICLSRNNCAESRNTFIVQNFPSSYQHFLEDPTTNKEFEYYIRDFSTSHPSTAIFSYKLLLTGKIKILNLDRVVPSDRIDFLDHRTPFQDFKQMRKYRFESSGRNSGNIPTTFEENEDEFSVYGKTYGANGRETTVICLALKNLVSKKIRVYNVNETCETHPASVDPANKYILDYLNIEIDENAMDLVPTTADEKAKRDSRTYHINLLNKFHDKKCYLCGCDIENLIIGSHIHRVTDIINSNLLESEKQKEIVDGDNGFWLCANHDKLFEYGLIYFDDNKLVISDKLTQLQNDFVKKITFGVSHSNKEYRIDNSNVEFSVCENSEAYNSNIFIINDCDYNAKMHGYLEKHKNRIQGS